MNDDLATFRSPDGAKRNPGDHNAEALIPDFASLHPGYELIHERNGSSDMDFSSGTVLRRLGFCANSLHRVPHATIFYVTFFCRHSPVGNPVRSDARIGSTGASSG
jgi:hypothetical protein